MLFLAVMVVQLGVVMITGDRNITHLNWTRNMTNKHWNQYISKHLFLSLHHKSMNKLFLIPRLHRASIHGKYFQLLARKQAVLCLSYSLHGSSRVLTEPTLRLVFKSSLCAKTPSYLWWNLFLHPLLRLNLTILTLRLREVFGSWERNNMVVSSMDTDESFSFEGTQSNVSLYLSGKDINMQANIKII